MAAAAAVAAHSWGRQDNSAAVSPGVRIEGSKREMSAQQDDAAAAMGSSIAPSSWDSSAGPTKAVSKGMPSGKAVRR